MTENVKSWSSKCKDSVKEQSARRLMPWAKRAVRLVALTLNRKPKRESRTCPLSPFDSVCRDRCAKTLVQVIVLES